MRFLLDANVPYSSLKIFEELNLKVIHVTDVGLSGASDTEILYYAVKRRSIIITKDLDFGTLTVFSKLPTYGVVILRLPFSFRAEEINATLKNFLETVDIKKLHKSITVLELGKYRIRKIGN
jgi:predicted nuclease of predicted toxin-antitoxin system